jgi:hypothetical protein
LHKYKIELIKALSPSEYYWWKETKNETTSDEDTWSNASSKKCSPFHYKGTRQERVNGICIVCETSTPYGCETCGEKCCLECYELHKKIFV